MVFMLYSLNYLPNTPWDHLIERVLTLDWRGKGCFYDFDLNGRENAQHCHVGTQVTAETERLRTVGLEDQVLVKGHAYTELYDCWEVWWFEGVEFVGGSFRDATTPQEFVVKIDTDLKHEK